METAYPENPPLLRVLQRQEDLKQTGVVGATPSPVGR